MPENIAAGALVAHMTVSDLDSGSQGQVECRLESDDEVVRNSFSLHRYQPDNDHFRFVLQVVTGVARNYIWGVNFNETPKTSRPRRRRGV